MDTKAIRKIKQLIRDRVKDFKKSEKTGYYYCRKCGGQLHIGEVNEVKKWEKEMRRLHNEHNRQNMFIRILNNLLFWIG